MCPSPHLLFLHAKQLILDQNFRSLWVPALICGVCMPNSEFWPRITSFYASQTSPAILSTHNSVLSTRIDYIGSNSHLSFSACKSAWLAPKLLVSMGPSHNLSFLCMQNSVISTCITSLYGSQPSSVVFACKTATFGPEYKSLWVPDLTCRFAHAKQRDLHQNDKFTLVPTLICDFVHVKQRL